MYQPQENGINDSMFDRFSLLHLVFGFAAKKSRLSLPLTFGIGLAWEFVEPILKEKHDEYIPNPSMDSQQNKLGDMIAVVVGWFLGGVI